MHMLAPGRQLGIYHEQKCSINIKYVIDISMTLSW